MGNNIEKNINVNFIDFDSKNLIATSEMSSKSLPSNFEERLVLHFLNDNWEVIEAKPIYSKDFIKEGNLDLFIKKVKIKFTNNENSFPISTICNIIPKVVETTINNDYLEIYQDDWRQIDILPNELTNSILTNLMIIKEIHNNYRIISNDLILYERIHIRENVDDPFYDYKLNFSSIKNELKIKKEYNTIKFKDQDGAIPNSFAFQLTKNLILYGVFENEHVKTISIMNVGKNVIEKIPVNLSAFLKRHNLLIVDWCEFHII